MTTALNANIFAFTKQKWYIYSSFELLDAKIFALSIRIDSITIEVMGKKMTRLQF